MTKEEKKKAEKKQAPKSDKKNGKDKKSMVELVHWVAEQGIDGVPPLSSAKALADEYEKTFPDKSADERIDTLIRWESVKNFGTGFVTGLGGVLAMPVAIPSALAASWVVQARLAGAIAATNGYDVHEPGVRALVMLCLLGDEASEVFANARKVGATDFVSAAKKKVPAKVLMEINKQVGARLVARTGVRGALNILKVVPLAGGFLTGGFDAVTCRKIGNVARKVFTAD